MHGMNIKLYRTQFPIKIAFSMTINKAQKQRLNCAAIYPPPPVFFPHAQLLVASFRSSSCDSFAVTLIEEH
jgi:hypothetical protein